MPETAGRAKEKRSNKQKLSTRVYYNAFYVIHSVTALVTSPKHIEPISTEMGDCSLGYHLVL